MFKKAFRLFLMSVLALSVIAAPTLAQDELPELAGEGIECPEGDAEVSFAGGAVGAEREIARQAADIFESFCPNVVIDILEMPDSATERLNLFLQFFEAESPDIDVLQVDVIWPAIIAPHVVDWNDYFTEDEIGEFFTDMVGGQTVDGRLVAIPFFADAAGMYYRTDLLDKYGVDVPETWADVAEAAEIIQEGEQAEGNEEFVGYVWQGNDYEGLTCDAHEWLVASTGDSFITADGEVNVTDAAFAAVVESAVGWVGTVSPEGVTTYQEEDSRNVFQSGNAAFMRNWPYAYNLGNAEDSPVAGNIDWVPLPTGESRVAACLGGWQIAVSQYSDNIDAAVEFAQYLTSFEQQRNRALVQGQLPSRPAVYEDGLVSADPLFQRAGPILATAFPRPSVITGDRYAEASAIFSGGIHDILTGEIGVEEGLTELEAALEDFLAEGM